ncbi:hypothetical protein SASPL_141839 [Salvia splendens]|uniref:Uncharacterized protein n=1 Tax=Salvia splendens TaxID=180675 RepID=A0A8X8WI52_SALSN|nr:hypothetical protein SASPL_141839 [Salvia splendens]
MHVLITYAFSHVLYLIRWSAGLASGEQSELTLMKPGLGKGFNVFSEATELGSKNRRLNTSLLVRWQLSECIPTRRLSCIDVISGVPSHTLEVIPVQPQGDSEVLESFIFFTQGWPKTRSIFFNSFQTSKSMMHLMDHDKIKKDRVKSKETECLDIQLSYDDDLRVRVTL